jgi:hypothetical protein
MIPWWAAALWFLLGVILTRHWRYRARRVHCERVTLSWDVPKRRVRIEFRQFGRGYDFAAEDAEEIGRFLVRASRRARGESAVEAANVRC